MSVLYVYKVGGRQFVYINIDSNVTQKDAFQKIISLGVYVDR